MTPPKSDGVFLFFLTLPEKLGRIIGIDYGRKRTGIAATDPMQIIANSITTIASREVLKFLLNYTQNEVVEAFVIGYPRQMNNKPSEAVKFIDPFIAQLKKAFPDKEIILMDERFTSKIAFQTMITGGVKKKDRQNKALLDSISATIILQSYLEQRNYRKNL